MRIYTRCLIWLLRAIKCGQMDLSWCAFFVLQECKCDSLSNMASCFWNFNPGPVVNAWNGQKVSAENNTEKVKVGGHSEWINSIQSRVRACSRAIQMMDAASVLLMTNLQEETTLACWQGSVGLRRTAIQTGLSSVLPNRWENVNFVLWFPHD